MMDLKHTTSIWRAKSIISSGLFIPEYKNPLAADAGLNLVQADTTDSYNLYKGMGAEIHFSWLGEVRAYQGESFPLMKDVLYRFEGWRYFIAVRSSLDQLQVTAIRIDGVEFLKQYPLNNVTTQLLPQSVIERIQTYRLEKLQRYMTDQVDNGGIQLKFFDV